MGNEVFQGTHGLGAEMASSAQMVVHHPFDPARFASPVQAIEVIHDPLKTAALAI